VRGWNDLIRINVVAKHERLAGDDVCEHDDEWM
jgi:hypothetical protein